MLEGLHPAGSARLLSPGRREVTPFTRPLGTCLLCPSEGNELMFATFLQSIKTAFLRPEEAGL